MSIIRFVLIYFFIVSFFCTGAEKKGYISISFNDVKVGSPYFVAYRTPRDFIIVGSRGAEIRRDQEKKLKSLNCHSVVKDGNKIVFFDLKELIITELNDNAIQDITKKMHFGETIRCLALDSSKNIVLISCNSIRNNGVVRKYNYNSGEYDRAFYGACSTMALNSEKNVLYSLEHDFEITIRSMNDLSSRLRHIRLFNFHHNQICYESDICFNKNMLAVYNPSAIRILDINKSNDTTIEYKLCYSSDIIKVMAFHPCGLIGALIERSKECYLIEYFDPAIQQKIDIVSLPTIKINTFCFQDDGLELAMTSLQGCMVMPVSPKVLKDYIMPPLWIKLKMMQMQYNLPRDIIRYCMNVFAAYCSKENYL